jgi:hypothetical protein
MTMRTTALLHGGDPAPGDPAAVRRLANTLRGVVHEVDRAAALVRAGHQTWWTGRGATAFAGGHDELLRQLRTARTAYGTAADALASWVVKLEAAQAEAVAIVVRAKAAARAAGVPSGAVPLAPIPPALIALQRARDTLATRARRDAQVCARVVEDASRQVGHFQHTLGQNIVAALVDASHVLRTASEILSVATLALALVPVVGQAVGTLALATSAALLVVDAGLAVSGHGSWKTVAADGLGVGLGAAGRAGAHIFTSAKAAKQFAASATEARHTATGLARAMPATQARVAAGHGSVAEVRLLAAAQHTARADAAELSALARQARAETTLGAGLRDIVDDPAGLAALRQAGLVHDAAAYRALPRLEQWLPSGAKEWTAISVVAADTGYAGAEAHGAIDRWVRQQTGATR